MSRNEDEVTPEEEVIEDQNPTTDEGIINAPAHGVQLGHIEAEANARHGIPTGTTPAPTPEQEQMAEDEPVRASQLDPDDPIDAVAGDLKPDTIVDNK